MWAAEGIYCVGPMTFKHSQTCVELNFQLPTSVGVGAESIRAIPWPDTALNPSRDIETRNPPHQMLSRPSCSERIINFHVPFKYEITLEFRVGNTVLRTIAKGGEPCRAMG